MNKSIQNKAINNRTKRVRILFGFLVLAMLLFLFSILKTIASDRRIPTPHKTMHDRAFRGAVISADNYTLSNSQKKYQAVIRGESIKPEKKDLFIKLFSIYSGMTETEIRHAFLNKKGIEKKYNIILSKEINTNRAMQLKALALKLRRLGVFRSIKTSSGKILYGLDIIEVGEYRRFPLHDVLSPVLGYMGKIDEDRYIRPKGIKGLEGHYNEHIKAKRDGYFRGKRDVLGAIIHDKNTINVDRINGFDLHLNISLSVQRRIEFMLDEMKEKIDAEQIMIGVMESQTGKVLSLATTERYDPSHIKQEDIHSLDPKFSEYPYESGSVLKPLTMAIALNHKVITPQTWFETGYKNFDITGGQRINDDEFFPSQMATDILVHSSNIGISQISWKLTGSQFREGLLKFGLAHKSGLDLGRDLPGFVKSTHLLNHKMHRANSSFGYGMTTTFTQMLKAYTAFNNDGIATTPRIVDYLRDAEGKHYKRNPKIGDKKAISATAANQVKKMLVEVVKRGTGKKARYVGLEVGGKTGTAHIAKNGRYTREYHSSFYGFANDKKGHKYTIGVLVIKAKKPYKYFASESAVPTFRNIVKILVNQKHLVPDAEEVAKHALTQKVIKKPIRKKPKPTSWKGNKKTTKPSKINTLFQMKKKPVNKPSIQKTSKPKPISPFINKSPNDLFEDMF